MFDFAALQTRIVEASVKAFADLAVLAPDDPVCSFALYSDDGAMTVCPSFDTAGKLAVRLAKSNNELAYKYCPPEWAYEAKGADREFTAICDDVRNHVMKKDTDFIPFRDQLFETCLRALDELRATGRYAPEILFLFDVPDTDIETSVQLAQMKRLNPGSPHVAEYMRWSETWAD